MEIDELVFRWGGVASWRQLVVEFPTMDVRRAVEAERLVRIGRGLYALPAVEEAPRAARRLNGALSLTSAALHHGWAVKTPPRKPHVTVPRHRKISVQRRRGVLLHFGEVEVDGIATAPVQTVIDCARQLPFDEALCVADSALRSGQVTRGELVAAAERSPRTGRPAALRVAGEADERAANPFESVIRAISREFPQLHLVPQVVLPFGRPDLYDPAKELVVECDSFRHHSVRDDLVSDVERYNAVELHRLGLLRFAWEHAMRRQDYVRDTFREWLEVKAVSERLAVGRRCPHCAA